MEDRHDQEAEIHRQKLVKGKRYQVRVRAQGDGGWGSWSKTTTTKKVK